MALIVGDDFQHILRVLNTNVDGREKVRRRFRFLLVREWAFGVRMCGLFFKSDSGEAKPFLGSCGSLLGRIASRDEWERWNATRARDGSWRGGNICTRECVSFEPFGCSRRARSGAKSDVILSFFSQNTHKKGRAFITPRACRVPRAKRFVYSPRDKRDFFSRHATGHVLSHENQRHRS